MASQLPKANYVFENHFHPYVASLVQALNQGSVAGMLDLSLQIAGQDFFHDDYQPGPANSDGDKNFTVTGVPKDIDFSESGPYSVYNWELFFHTPLAIAVHLSKSQRFVEAQQWFHYIFDPTVTDTTTPVPDRFWKFARFRNRQPTDMPSVAELIAVLSEPPGGLSTADQQQRAAAAISYEGLRRNPFAPHRVARTRVIAYQYYVVMKYLDNLIAWGDSLFRQDTAEAVNEATQLYVLAADLLGPAPAEVPRYASAPRMSFNQLKNAPGSTFGADFGDALVDLENQLPFAQTGTTPSGTGETTALLGMGRSLYFCVPRNDQLTGYWDTVADRLYKIRHCQDITGTVRQLALFAPPLDPGLLVAASAAGIDLAAAVAAGQGTALPVRAVTLMAKAIEIAVEVKSAGSALLAAMEKRDGEALARKRQQHEVEMSQLARDVRYLAWKQSEQNTEALLRSRAVTFARYRHFQLLLGKAESDIDKLRDVTLTRQTVTEDTFATVYANLVATYDVAISQETRPNPQLVGNNDPQIQSGAQSSGSLDLITNESAELNDHMPRAADLQSQATDVDKTFSVLGMLPNIGVALFPIGVGAHIQAGGQLLSAVGHTIASSKRGLADQRSYDGVRAAKIAAYQRRDLDFVQQSNLAALELMQNGRQLIAALVAEQVASSEYDAAKQQIDKAQDIDTFLADKDTNTTLYTWLCGEVTRSYAERYRMAIDVARAAEQAVKTELMRPELDGTNFIGYSQWDTGHQGLQAGERLHHDLTALQLAYLDNNRREYELTTHVSLRMLDPTQLLNLRSRGTCRFDVPEWFFDLQTPGHYLRRIRHVALSLPAITGPYTTVAATLSLQRSSIRRDPGLTAQTYTRASGQDSRFLDYPGALESIVTSSASSDAGLFEPTARDERYLPFEGAGAISTWQLDLPTELRLFDYSTISDAVLHIGYTARAGVRADAVTNDLRARFADATSHTLARSFSLRHDFPNAWAAFMANPTGGVNVTIDKTWFPYFTQSQKITLTAVDLYGIAGEDLFRGPSPAIDAAATAFADAGTCTLSVAADDRVVRAAADADPYLVVQYTLPPAATN
jgi:Tc toxin complex TcA C-terminal TcB-binding domain